MRMNATETARLKAIAEGNDTSGSLGKKALGELRLYGLVEIEGEIRKGDRITRYGHAVITEAGKRVLASLES